MKMKALMILFFLNITVSYSQAREFVHYLSRDPVINGIAEPDISNNKMKSFDPAHIHRSNPAIEIADVQYFLGYTATHLYIYIEVAADSVIRRDRAYQNGDGFHLTIGAPRPYNEETDEFYVFGFSPVDDWSNKMSWYYNVDLAMGRLGNEVEFETAEGNGKVSFECLIPWGRIKPYHPWISEGIAFNLCFVKAVGETDKIFYFIKTDERMQSEQSRRKYTTLQFESPSL